MAARKAVAAAKPAPKKPVKKTTPRNPAAKKTKYLRAEQIFSRLEGAYPDAKCALDHENPLQLLVATILSAQSTDKMVNSITPALFNKYKTAEAFANADTAELETLVHSTGFFRNKAKSVKASCRIIAEQYSGKVPDTMEELLKLPGVARKTANVVLGVAYGKAEGIVVDTHVQRLSRRLDFSKEERPDKIEQDLMQLFPRNKWIQLAHLLIHHGRAKCVAVRPKCAECPIEDLCYSEDKTV
ncbi:MAG: endonuclease III [Acidobacteria bacterium]|nr:MAG: endonuclease III [Acidobacteriota bacterium]